MIILNVVLYIIKLKCCHSHELVKAELILKT